MNNRAHPIGVVSVTRHPATATGARGRSAAATRVAAHPPRTRTYFAVQPVLPEPDVFTYSVVFAPPAVFT